MSRRWRIGLVIGGIGLAATAVAGAAVGLGGDPATTTTVTAPPSTAPVTRTSLTQTELVNGVLDYGEPVPLNGRGSGIVTWLPTLGATIDRGQRVYEANDRPVSLFYGDLPLYRQLRTGHIGDDVLEVERNLAALGHTGITVDRRYTSATATAVRKWQRDRGLTQTGTFNPADVVIAPGKLRIASLAVRLGDPANGPILTYTGTTRVVRIDLDVALQRLAKRGTTATITLPDGEQVEGTVATVGSVATAGDEEGNEPATIEVTVTLADQSELGALDQAPVGVELVSARAPNVLTVPVAALVALADGGYGVQALTGTTSRSIPVELGMFGNGRVEISGTGISEGTRVVVPS